MLTHLYTKIVVYINKQLVTEQSAFNLIERKDDSLITITSEMPCAGLEYDPEIGKIDEITIFFSDIEKSYRAELIEKKTSGSVNKHSYQLLTYKILSKMENC